MSNKSLGRRAREIAGGLALGVFAVGAHAEPFSLQGTCYVQSLATTGQGCQLTYTLVDDFLSPTGFRKGQIRINGAVVLQYVNDNVTPVDSGVLVGSTHVACGATYTVTAYIAELPVNSVYVKVGSLPPVACPAQP
jgi:hypothetical protein